MFRRLHWTACARLLSTSTFFLVLPSCSPQKYPQLLVVITCGPQGAIAGHGDRRERAAAHPVAVQDTVGAGDTFAAAFLSEFLENGDLPAALEFGCAAGALAVQRAGGPATFRFQRSEVEAIRSTRS